MKVIRNNAERRSAISVQMYLGFALTITLLTLTAAAQTQPAADAKPAEQKRAPETYQTIYLTNAAQVSDLNDIQTALRNVLQRAKLYGVPSDEAIVISATPEEMLLAQKMISDLDRPRKIYRLTYTITEVEGGKVMGTQRYVLVAVAGAKTAFKEGTRVPILTGVADAATSTKSSEIQYVDVGLNIDATAVSLGDGVSLRTKVEQSRLADEKPTGAMPDPVIHQTVLEGSSILVRGKPLVLGSLDIPGTTRHEEIEVVAEPVR